MMSAWGWPEPRTGIRLPRGQCGHDCSSRVNEFSSRMARSRYFSLISSSVTGMEAPVGFDEGSLCPWPCISTCALQSAWLTSRPPPPVGGAPYAAGLAGAAGGGGGGCGFQELQRLHVQQAGRAGEDVGVAQRLHELLRAVEIAHA